MKWVRRVGMTLQVGLICTICVCALSQGGFHAMDAPGSNPGSLPIENCTTVLVGKAATADGSVMMAHNEDMGDHSGRLLYVPGKAQADKEIALNYVTIPQVDETLGYWATGNSDEVAVKHFDGGWILCGMNEHGVSFGCNFVYTREEPIPRGEGILRYSIRRLIIERARSAREAVDLIAEMIEAHGQSENPTAYCIADSKEAWLVETTFRRWVALRIPDDGFRVIGNEYTIESDWDLASDDLVDFAIEQGWHDPEMFSFSFKEAYGDPQKINLPRNVSREWQGHEMLKRKIGAITVEDLLGVLSQPPIQRTVTQSYMVWHLRPDMPTEVGCVMWFGFCGANTGIAAPLYCGSSRVPKEYTFAPLTEDLRSGWWRFDALQRILYPERWVTSRFFCGVRSRFDRAQENLFKETPNVEGEVLTLLEKGEDEEARKLLSDHTYVALDLALQETTRALSSLR